MLVLPADDGVLQHRCPLAPPPPFLLTRKLFVSTTAGGDGEEHGRRIKMAPAAPLPSSVTFHLGSLSALEAPAPSFACGLLRRSTSTAAPSPRW